MTILDKIKAIEQLQKLDTPWQFKRFFGPINLAGNQLCIGDDTDYGSVAEYRQAVQWLANELGGEVKWKKEKKNETKID